MKWIIICLFSLSIFAQDYQKQNFQQHQQSNFQGPNQQNHMKGGHVAMGGISQMKFRPPTMGGGQSNGLLSHSTWIVKSKDPNKFDLSKARLLASGASVPDILVGKNGELMVYFIDGVIKTEKQEQREEVLL